MSWEGSDRRRRLPPDWADVRARILERDGFQCTWVTNGDRCTEPGNDVDHRVPGDDHGDDNLQSLCRRHHLTKSSAEGNAVRHRHRRQRPPEQHPGLL